MLVERYLLKSVTELRVEVPVWLQLLQPFLVVRVQICRQLTQSIALLLLHSLLALLIPLLVIVLLRLRMPYFFLRLAMRLSKRSWRLYLRNLDLKLWQRCLVRDCAAILSIAHYGLNLPRLLYLVNKLVR